MSLPLSAKRVDLLKQAFPKLTQTTVIWARSRCSIPAIRSFRPSHAQSRNEPPN